MNPTDHAVAVLASLVDHVGNWGDNATPEQWEDARAILDADNPVRRHWIGRAKGYSKTRDAAGMSISALLTQFPSGASGYVAASDAGQAGLVRQSIEGFVACTPGLENQLHVDLYRVTARSGAELVILPADSAGSHGLRPFWLLVDELANWPDVERHRSFWNIVWAGLPKVPGSRGVVITTAGSPSHFSRKVYEEAGTEKGWRLSDLHGPPPWMDPEEMEAERRRLPASVFARWWMNEWSAADDAFADPDDLKACVTLSGPLPADPTRSYVCGLDIGIKSDRTVAAICHGESVLDESGSATGRRIVLDRMQVWAGSRRKPVELGVVEEWLLEAHRQYRCDLVADPWQAIGMLQRLRARGVKVREFTFSQGSVGRLATTLHTTIRDRHLALPDDKELLEELAAVRLRETNVPGVLRMDHDASRHDDRAIALALAAWSLLEHVPKKKARMVAGGRLTPVRTPATSAVGMKNDPMIARAPRAPWV